MDSKKGTIGLSVLTLTNPFFKEIADRLAEEARVVVEAQHDGGDLQQFGAVVGLGPAGYTMAHYLLNEGCGVVGVDEALVDEPLQVFVVTHWF